MPDQTSQAPVAGADPRAWREMRESEAPASVSLVAARLLGLVDALVIRDDDGTVLPRMTAVAQEYVRDAAEAWAGAVLAQRACEDVAAELSPVIDPECTDPSELACRAAYEIIELRAATARGAEGERGVEQLCDELRSAYAALRKFGRHVGCETEHDTSAACDCGFDAARLGPGPRPSAGPAAPDHVRAGQPFTPDDLDTLAAWGEQHASASVQAMAAALRQLTDARASDDPAPTTPDKMNCPEARKPGGCQLHNLHCRAPECFTAAPAAPEVPRG